jgi:hypothetical protein
MRIMTGVLNKLVLTKKLMPVYSGRAFFELSRWGLFPVANKKML